MLILCPRISNRLVYCFDFVLKEQLGLDYELTTDTTFYHASNSPRFTYGVENHHEKLFDHHQILFDAAINETAIDLREPVDLFAAIFYLITRYREYHFDLHDAHGRFREQDHELVKAGLEKQPVVDEWIARLRRLLHLRFPSLQFRKQSFRSVFTFDIDQAYLYRGKQWWRQAAGFIRSLIYFDATAIERLRVLAGSKEDPFDVYDYLIELHKESSTELRFFIHVGDYSRFDKPVSFRHSRWQNQIRKLAEKFEVGIHPSYRSFHQPEILRAELQRLEEITGRKITSSRQHYLRLQFPETYRQLIANGITDDFTMGFASQSGFRAGTSQSFLFYDLLGDCVTPLRVHPFSFMDAGYHYYMRTIPELALQDMRQLLQRVQATEGVFTGLWHNSFLSEWDSFRGWSHVYSTILQEASQASRL
jgi:hypothetical protein